jgi:hypothetical protein
MTVEKSLSGVDRLQGLLRLANCPAVPPTHFRKKEKPGLLRALLPVSLALNLSDSNTAS